MHYVDIMCPSDYESTLSENLERGIETYDDMADICRAISKLTHACYSAHISDPEHYEYADERTQRNLSLVSELLYTCSKLLVDCDDYYRGAQYSDLDVIDSIVELPEVQWHWEDYSEHGGTLSLDFDKDGAITDYRIYRK